MKSIMSRELSANHFSTGPFVIFVLSTKYPPLLATCTNPQNLAILLLANNEYVSSDLRNAGEHFQRAKEMDEDWEKTCSKKDLTTLQTALNCGKFSLHLIKTNKPVKKKYRNCF